MEACVKIREGSGFFTAEHYIVTCAHVLQGNNTKLGDTICYYWKGKEYKADIDAISEEKDLALLYAEDPPGDCESLKLDRIANPGTEARLYGYPTGKQTQKNTLVLIGEEDSDGRICLDKANNAKQGYSGGPVISVSNNAVVGIFNYISNPDQSFRGLDAAGMISAEAALELWPEKLNEVRYTVSPDKRNPFVYNSLKTQYTDPNKNVKLLRKFVNSEHQICWWSVVGEGGSGKSRLAYELAHSLPSTWRCYLLSPNQLTIEKLDALCASAGRNVLFIANYAYTNTGELGNWLDGVVMSAREKRPSHRIRVLLLQRKGKDVPYSSWRESLLYGHRTLEEHRYRVADLELNIPGKQQLVDIMRSYALSRNQEISNSNCERLYQALKTVDSSFTRPLFAMFITDAYLDDGNLFKWDPESALNHFCRKEWSILDRAVGPSMSYAGKTLLVLGTITHGYSLSSNALPHVAEKEEQSVSSRSLGRALANAGFAEETQDSWIVDPMTPDLLGEWFVLTHFKEYRDKISDILNTARDESPIATSDFLTRLFTDYPVDIDITKACCQSNILMAHAVSWGLVRRPDPDTLNALYNTYKTEPSQAKLWLIQYAKGLFNYFNHQSDSKIADEVIEKLHSLYKDSKKNVEVAIQYANGLFNHFSRQTEPDRADDVLKQLRELYEQSTGIAKAVVIPYIKGIVNFIDKGYMPENSNEIFEQLCTVYENNDTNNDVIAWFAKGLFSFFKRQADSETAHKILERLKNLYEDKSGIPEVAVQYAWGLFIDSTHRSDSERIIILVQLRTLYEDTFGNDRVALRYAWALANHYRKQTIPEQAYEILMQLGQLCFDYPQNNRILNVYAEELHFFFSTQKTLIFADEVLIQLRALYLANPSIQGVALLYAQGLYDYICHQTEYTRVRKRLEELRILSKKYSSVNEIPVLYAKGLYNQLCRQTDSKQAETLLKKFNNLYNANLSNDQIVLWYSNGLYNQLCRQIDLKLAEKYTGQIRNICMAKPTEEKAIWLAKALIICLMSHVKDAAKGMQIITEMRNLAGRFRKVESYYRSAQMQFNVKFGLRTYNLTSA